MTLRNGSGSDRQGIVVRMGSTDPTVACIPTPSSHSAPLLAGEVREASVPLVLRVADVARLDPFQDLSITLEFVISGDDFGTTMYPQERDARRGPERERRVLFPPSYTEGFENAGFGSFTTQSLDAGRESLAASNGFRCQYNDPDFVNSNSYGNTCCFLGAPSAAQNAYDWHVHDLASPDGGRAYLGNNSLHWGVHPGAASADTTRLKQLDADPHDQSRQPRLERVTPELSFKHQVGLADSDFLSAPDDGEAVDRGIVQVQLASSSGQAIGSWRKIAPTRTSTTRGRPTSMRTASSIPPTTGTRRTTTSIPPIPRAAGPAPPPAIRSLSSPGWAAIAFNAAFDPGHIGRASDGPGLQGSRGPGTWVESKFDLARWRGRRVRFRFLATSIEVGDSVTMQQALAWNPTEGDDGWYIDDVRVTNTLTSAATVTVDTADRSGLPACGPVCTSVTASLVATPAIIECSEAFTLDASGSVADQCPGGALQFRFQWQFFLREGHAAVLQDWNENGIVSHTIDDVGFDGPFGIAWTSAARPFRRAKRARPWRCPSISRSCPSLTRSGSTPGPASFGCPTSDSMPSGAISAHSAPAGATSQVVSRPASGTTSAVARWSTIPCPDPEKASTTWCGPRIPVLGAPKVRG